MAPPKGKGEQILQVRVLRSSISPTPVMLGIYVRRCDAIYQRRTQNNASGRTRGGVIPSPLHDRASVQAKRQIEEVRAAHLRTDRLLDSRRTRARTSTVRSRPRVLYTSTALSNFASRTTDLKSGSMSYWISGSLPIGTGVTV